MLQIFFSLNLFMFIAMSDIENNLLFLVSDKAVTKQVSKTHKNRMWLSQVVIASNPSVATNTHLYFFTRKISHEAHSNTIMTLSFSNSITSLLFSFTPVLNELLVNFVIQFLPLFFFSFFFFEYLSIFFFTRVA